MTLLRAIRQLSHAPRLHSAWSIKPRKTLTQINELYAQKKPISVVTAWDFITGQMAEKADVDITLIGDSLAMVALGYEDTNELELNEFLYHVRAVSRGNRASLLVADVPFGSFELSESQAVETAVSLVKRGRAQAVKIEGGEEICPTVQRIVGAGIPVMGHVGLAPQKHNTTGGYKLQGNTAESAVQIIKDCWALEKAGAFSIVLECVPNKLAQLVTSTLSVPTIGIGAGPHVSGQVLVMADMLGMNDLPRAKFVKQYNDFSAAAQESLEAYKSDLANGTFPDPDVHGYKMKSDVLQAARAFVQERCK